MTCIDKELGKGRERERRREEREGGREERERETRVPYPFIGYLSYIAIQCKGRMSFICQILDQEYILNDHVIWVVMRSKQARSAATLIWV